MTALMWLSAVEATAQVQSPPDLPTTATADEIFQQVFGRTPPVIEEAPYPVIIAGINTGDVAVKPGRTPDEAVVDTKAILDLLAPFLVEEKLIELRQRFGGRRTIMASELQTAGITAGFDSQSLSFAVDIPSQFRTVTPISLLRRYNPALTMETLPPAKFSGALNVLAGGSWVQRSEQLRTGLQQRTARVEGWVNYRGAVLNTGFTYDEEEGHGLQRSDTTLSYDFVPSAIRVQAGDLDAPHAALQGSPEILGIGAFRNFDTRPYDLIRPTPSQQFVLQRPARVSVYVNGAFQRDLRLQSGRYNLTDLPLRSASGNDVELQIQYDTGEIQRVVFSAFFDIDLLKPGISEFSFGAGVPGDIEDGRRVYDYDRPSVTGFYRRGITDTLTVGGNFEADRDRQVVGGEAIVATKVGTFGLLGAWNAPGGADGTAWTGFYRWNGLDLERRITVDLLARYAGPEYDVLGTRSRGLGLANDARGRIGFNLSRDTRLTFGAEYRRSRRDLRDESGQSITINRNMRWGNLSLAVRHDEYETRSEYSFNVSFNIPIGRGGANASYDSQQESFRAIYNRPPEPGADGLGYDLGYLRQTQVEEATAGINYVANRFDARIEQRVGRVDASSFGSESRTTAFLGSALVFAGNRMAISRPVFDSFAMFDRNKQARQFQIAVDPQGRFGSADRKYAARTSWLGPAVVPDLHSYLVRTIDVDAPDAPAGVSVGGESFTLLPTYKSGYWFEVGGDGNLAMIGRVVDAAGKPIAFGAGYAKGADGVERPIFSNAGGRFYVDEVKPGDTVELRFESPMELVARISTSKDAIGIARLTTDIVARAASEAGEPQNPTFTIDGKEMPR